MESTHHELLAKVAAMYYEQEMTQHHIADLLDMSRVKVYRLLKEARQAQVVRILIDWPIKRSSDLEARLVREFGLERALVLQTSLSDAAQRLRQIGQMTARCLEEMLDSDSTLSICFGRSTYEVIAAVRSEYRANVKVVQATGSLPHALKEYDSSALTRQLAQKLGGEALYLSAPLLADSPEAAEVIRRQEAVERTLEQMRRTDIALVGIGDLDPATSAFVKAGVVEAAQLRSYREQGAIGDMAWQIFDSAGRLYPCEFHGRIIGITLDELRDVPQTIAVAIGMNKAAAMLGALRTRVINVLCTDRDTARRMLDLHSEKG